MHEINFNNFIWANALDKPLSNGKNRSSLSCSYQDLFKKIPNRLFFKWAVPFILNTSNKCYFETQKKETTGI
jgi:hypothetical protein